MASLQEAYLHSKFAKTQRTLSRGVFLFSFLFFLHLQIKSFLQLYITYKPQLKNRTAVRHVSLVSHCKL